MNGSFRASCASPSDTFGWPVREEGEDLMAKRRSTTPGSEMKEAEPEWQQLIGVLCACAISFGRRHASRYKGVLDFDDIVSGCVTAFKPILMRYDPDKGTLPSLADIVFERRI